MRASTQNLPLMKAFAAEVRARRSSMGISQEEFAHRCEINRTFVAKIETGKNQPSLTVLLKIAEGLNISVGVLMDSAVARYKFESDDV